MSTIKERLNGLKEKNPKYKTNSDLLRAIYQYLYENDSQRVKGVSEDEFVNNTKGSFSSMIDEKRDFDPSFFYPLEKTLNTSMVYILEGTGEKMSENEQRGLRYAAYTDTKGNYQKLIDEGVYLEQDEYQCTLLDYMVDYKSGIGFEFFASRGELPLDEVCRHKRGFNLEINQHSDEELVTTMIKVCKPDTMLRYLDGYYFAEKGFDPEFLRSDDKAFFETLGWRLSLNAALRDGLSNYKQISLKAANPNLALEKGQTIGKATFVNFFFNQMIQILWPDIDVEEDSDLISRGLFEKAIEINKAVMPAILELGYPSYRIGNSGYVYANGLICGSIVAAFGRLDESEMSVFCSKETIEAYNRLVEQVEEFQERITANSKLSILNGEMRLAKHDNSDFYDFYHLMKERGVDNVALLLDDEDGSKDRFRLPEGKQEALNYGNEQSKFREAIRILSKIDSISEESLGEGKVYSFPNLNNRSFFVDNSSVTGIAPIDVEIGTRYDNLARFLSNTVLLSPAFFSADGMVAAVVSTIDIYGVKKKELVTALHLMSDYYLKSASTINSNEERGKILIASAHQRALWLQLFEKEIVSQYK